MWQRKLCLIAAPGLLFVFLACIPACSQPPVTTETQQPVSLKPAEFELGPVTFLPSVVMADDPAIATASLKNTGDIAGTYTATLSVDGQELSTKALTIDPKSMREVSFPLSELNAGTHTVAINDSSTVLTVYSWSPYVINYNEADGSTDGIYVSGEQGHIVDFTPPAKPFKVPAVKVFGMVKNATIFSTKVVTLRIWDKEENNLLWSQDFPWTLFLGADWHEMAVPDVRVDGDFYVELVTHSDPSGGDPIDFVPIMKIGGPPTNPEAIPQILLIIGFDYPKSYTSSPSNRPETRSGYSLNGKPFDPGQKRLEGINWLIRVEGEGPPG